MAPCGGENGSLSQTVFCCRLESVATNLSSHSGHLAAYRAARGGRRAVWALRAAHVSHDLRCQLPAAEAFPAAPTAAALRICLLKRPFSAGESAELGTADERGTPRFAAVSVSNPFVFCHEVASHGAQGRCTP